MTNARAKTLRQNMTPVERKLWLKLKQLRGTGFHFRKQAGMGPYVVDFVCHRAKLVIEVDGGQHNEDRQIARDSRRTAWLASRRYRVVRFWNNEVVNEMDGVLRAIDAALDQQRALLSENIPPPLAPPRVGGGGSTL